MYSCHIKSLCKRTSVKEKPELNIIYETEDWTAWHTSANVRPCACSFSGQWRWKSSPMPSAGLPQEVTVGPHMPSSSQIQWFATKNEKWNGKPRLECVNDRHPSSKTPVGVIRWTYQSGWQSNHHKWLASRKIWSVEKLETLPAGTKPRTSHHWSPEGERRGKREHQTVFLERTRDGHRESDDHWNRFKGDVGETSERRGGAHMDFSESMDTILNWTELTRRRWQPLLVLLTTTSQQLRRSSGEGRRI